MAGKKSKTSAKSSAKPKTVTVDGEKLSLEASLDRALITLENNRLQILSLQDSWGTQLRRIGTVILFLALKQASVPVYGCLDEIHEWNERLSSDNDALFIGKSEAGKYCITDSLTEIFSVLCCLSLLWLMYQPIQGSEFKNLPFRLSLAFVPVIIASYQSNPTIGCLGDLMENGSSDTEGADNRKRAFPNVLIYLFISVGSRFIMQYQRKQSTESIQKVTKMKEDLVKSSKKKK